MKESFLTPEEKPEPIERVNFHEVSEKRKELRKAITQLGGKGSIFDKHYKEPLAEANEQASDFKVPDLSNNWGGMKVAVEDLKRQKAEYEEQILAERAHIDYKEILKAEPRLSEVKDIIEKISVDQDFMMRRMFENRHPRTTESAKIRNKGVLKSINQEIAIGEEKLEKADQVVVRQAEILEYKENLAQSGHICITPSVEKDLKIIGKKMLSGEPMLLYGPTGTGKTSLAKYASEHFTGKRARVVACDSQTKESNIYGKTGVRPSGKAGAMETFVDYGPLIKAAQEGCVCVFDEFNTLDPGLLVVLKNVFSTRIGDPLDVPGNGTVILQPGFQAIFTANLKSEKNPERQDIPPEILREFDVNSLKVKYTPADEAYDIILSRLLNQDGSLDMSYFDLNTTLPNLVKVMAEIQESYTNETNKEVAERAGHINRTNGKVLHSFEKFVMTQGTIQKILSLWLVEKQMGENGTSFSEFLDQNFKSMLTLEGYPQEDRILAAKILASKGFLTALTAKDLDLPEDIFKLNTIKQMRGEDAITELQEKSGQVKHLSLKEVAMLDPFGKRALKVQNQAEALLGDENTEKGDDFSKRLKKKLKDKKGKEQVNIDPESLKTEFTSFLEETWNRWGVDAEKIKKAVISPEIIDPKNEDYDVRQADIDGNKFGEFTVNPDTQNLDWEALKDKIFVPDLSALNGKPLGEVAEYLIDNFSDKYKIPGIEFWKFMIENPDKVPADANGVNLKDGNYYYTFGSLVRYSDGHFYVPFVHWFGSDWRRGARRLGPSWDADCRAVLLEI